MVQTLATNRSNHSLDMCPLLRHSWRAKDFLNSKVFDLFREIRTEDRSRPRNKKRGALSHGNASRTCCAVHSAVG
jgi:hypothetical protein